VLQDIGGNARSLLDQAEQDMFGPDIFMVEALRLLVGELHHLAGPVGESFIHWPITLRHSWTISCWKEGGIGGSGIRGWKIPGPKPQPLRSAFRAVESHKRSDRFPPCCSKDGLSKHSMAEKKTNQGI